MKSISQVINDNYYVNKPKLEQDFKTAREKNKTFKKIVTNLNLPDNYLMKYTTKLEETAIELNNCSKCQNLMECKNSYQGYIFYPELLNDNLVFDYIPCKYKQEFDERTKYQKNIYLFELPKEIKEASMKNIDLDDSNRF
jgi:hypothetical protein